MKFGLALGFGLVFSGCTSFVELPSTAHHYNRGRANLNDSVIDIGIGASSGPNLATNVPGVPETNKNTASQDPEIINPGKDEGGRTTRTLPNISLGSNLGSSSLYLGLGLTHGLFGMYDWFTSGPFASTLALAYSTYTRTVSRSYTADSGTEDTEYQMESEGRLSNFNTTLFISYKLGRDNGLVLLVPYAGMGMNAARATVKNKTFAFRATKHMNFADFVFGLQLKAGVFDLSYEVSQTQYKERGKIASFVSDSSLLIGLTFGD